MRLSPPSALARAALLGISLAAAACSGTTEPATTALAPGQASAAPGTYQLNAEETALDCKKLTGRMQVRILQSRDALVRQNSTSISQTMQQAAATVGANSTPGADPKADFARDRAQLEAYNQRLAALNCKTFNLDDELQPKAITATPRPVDKAAPGPAGGASVTVPIDQVGANTTVKKK